MAQLVALHCLNPGAQGVLVLNCGEFRAWVPGLHPKLQAMILKRTVSFRSETQRVQGFRMIIFMMQVLGRYTLRTLRENCFRFRAYHSDESRVYCLAGSLSEEFRVQG